MRHVCELCGVRFDRRLSGNRPIRFCGQSCYHAWRSENGVTTGQFVAGQRPWNHGVKGIHLSPATEFKAGGTTDRLVPIGTIRVRKAKIGRRRYIKTANGWTEYAKWLWIDRYGRLLAGDVVHHMNGERLDDRFENLIALPRTDHPKIHNQWGIRPLSEDEIEAYRGRYQDYAEMARRRITNDGPMFADVTVVA
jgi:hypothetical protein